MDFPRIEPNRTELSEKMKKKKTVLTKIDQTLTENQTDLNRFQLDFGLQETGSNRTESRGYLYDFYYILGPILTTHCFAKFKSILLFLSPNYFY